MSCKIIWAWRVTLWMGTLMLLNLCENINIFGFTGHRNVLAECCGGEERPNKKNIFSSFGRIR